MKLSILSGIALVVLAGVFYAHAFMDSSEESNQPAINEGPKAAQVSPNAMVTEPGDTLNLDKNSELQE